MRSTAVLISTFRTVETDRMCRRRGRYCATDRIQTRRPCERRRMREGIAHQSAVQRRGQSSKMWGNEAGSDRCRSRRGTSGFVKPSRLLSHQPKPQTRTSGLAESWQAALTRSSPTTFVQLTSIGLWPHLNEPASQRDPEIAVDHLRIFFWLS
jgi:hypothetical protein